MEEISVHFTLNYGCELSPKEGRPRLLVYLDSNVENEPIEVPLSEDSVDQTIKMTIIGKINRRQKLPVDTQLVFYTTCEKLNDFGSPCRVDAGFATIPLYAMANSGNRFTKNLALQLATVKHFEKGKLHITSSQSDVHMGRVRWEHRSDIGAPLSEISMQNSPMLEVEMQLAQTIERTMKMGAAMKNTWAQTANVRVPIYYGDVGMQRKVPLPAAAFFFYQEMKSNKLFWTNLIKTVLARENKTVHDVDRMDVTHRARVMVEMVSSYAQYLDYIGDSVDNNRRFTRGVEGFINAHYGRNYDARLVKGCERFGDAGRDLCGDCEDLATLIGMVFRAMLKADFSDHPQLRELQRIGHQYVDFVSLDAVTSAAVHYGQTERKIGAHMNCNFLPAIYVKQCVERAIGKTTDLPFRPFSEDAAQLPVLIGEGTGMFECYGISDTISAERNAVYRSMQSLKFAKKPIVHAPGAPSSFFVGSLEGFTPYFFEQGANVCGFWYGYAGGEQFQRGLDFVELERASPKAALLPHPAFSNEEMLYMKHACRIRVPPHPLVLTQEAIASHMQSNNKLDFLCELVRKQGRDTTIDQPPAPIYVRGHQLTDQVVREMAQDIRRLPIVTKMVYTPEIFTDLVSGYEVGISGNVQ